MLRLRDILMWEALSGKPFGRLDGQDMDDVLMLMYVCKNESRKYTYRVWSEVYRKYQQAAVAKFGREISEDIAYCGQFKSCDQSQDTGEDGKRGVGEEKESGEEIYYTEVIGKIMTDGGMDAEWVLGQPFEMLPILSKMVEEHEERRIEDSRFWAFILTAPYRKPDCGIRTPEKWLPMPFDKKKKKLGITQAEADEAREIFKRWAEEEAKKQQAN